MFYKKRIESLQREIDSLGNLVSSQGRRITYLESSSSLQIGEVGELRASVRLMKSKSEQMENKPNLEIGKDVFNMGAPAGELLELKLVARDDVSEYVWVGVCILEGKVSDWKVCYLSHESMHTETKPLTKLRH